jgi:hypothetical protein
VLPTGFWDISLLFAITAIMLLIISELLSSYYGKVNILIDKKKLRNAAIALSILFLITLAIRILEILWMGPETNFWPV